MKTPETGDQNTHKEIPLKDLIEKLSERERNFQILEAAQSKNWEECRRLYQAGINVNFKDSALLSEIIKQDDAEGYKFLTEIFKESSTFAVHALYSCIKLNKKDTLKKILTEDIEKKYIAYTLSFALDQKKHDIADLLFTKLDGENVSWGLLQKCLMAERIDLYRKILVMDIKSRPGIELLLLAAVRANRTEIIDEIIPNINAYNYSYNKGGPPFMQETVYTMVKNNNIKSLKIMFERIPCHKDLQFDILSIAIDQDNAEALKVFLDAFKPKQTALDTIINGTLGLQKPNCLRYLLEKVSTSSITEQCPLEVEQLHILKTFCRKSESSENFFWAINQGISFPQKSNVQADLLHLAVQNDHKDIIHYILEHGNLAPPEIASFENSPEFKYAEIAFQLNQDEHFAHDALFWLAVKEEKTAFVDDFLKDHIIPETGNLEFIKEALIELTINQNTDLLKKILNVIKIPHTLLKEVFETALSESFDKTDISYSAVKLLTDAGMEPFELESRTFSHLIKAGDVKTIKFLKEKGFTYHEDFTTSALSTALIFDNSDLIEYLLSQKKNISVQEAFTINEISSIRNKDILDLLFKWSTRHTKETIDDLKTTVDKTLIDNLFDGENSIALKAAYADKFSTIVQKMKEHGTLDTLPEKLITTKDKRGNTLLDILGAHKKLHDILIPSLWFEKDFSSFIKKNIPPCYHAKYEFNLFQSRIKQRKLKNKARKKKGPKL